uniref:Uncharacterized protein n=1 Tax=Megaselia scalaris TaxID=36166 RepID=T1GMA4_MEGSC
MFCLIRLLRSNHLSSKIKSIPSDDTACTIIWFRKLNSNIRRRLLLSASKIGVLLLTFEAVCINGE